MCDFPTASWFVRQPGNSNLSGLTRIDSSASPPTTTSFESQCLCISAAVQIKGESLQNSGILKCYISTSVDSALLRKYEGRKNKDALLVFLEIIIKLELGYDRVPVFQTSLEKTHMMQFVFLLLLCL